MTTKDEKQRRMQIRRDTGSRVVPEPRPRPKGPDYLVAHACFVCRKSFKRALEADRDPVCPECGGAIHAMGRSFKAPKKGDTEQWRKVQALYANGFRFFSYRSFPDAPQLPERSRDVEAFLAENPTHPFRVAAPNKELEPTG